MAAVKAETPTRPARRVTGTLSESPDAAEGVAVGNNTCTPISNIINLIAPTVG